MKVFGINASVRKDGNTAIMLGHVMDAVKKEGIDSEIYQLGPKRIAGCIACGACKKNQDHRCSIKSDDMNEIIEKMEAADAIVLGAPTYFADAPANMRAVIERAGMVNRANGDMLKRKLGASVVVARRGGAIQTFNTTNAFFTIGQMIIVGSSYWNMGFGGAIGEVADDAEAIETMTTLGENIAWLLKKIND